MVFYRRLNMRKSLLLVLALFLGLSGSVFAEPCAFVTDPADIRFVALEEIAKFLEKDLAMGKGVTNFIGNKVIDHKFRKAGMPDPAKEPVYYAIVGQEMPGDMLNVAFILKGDVKSDKFLEFTDKRYEKYFETLKKQGIKAAEKKPRNARINGKNSRIYPFAFRNSDAIVTYFDGYTIIATCPQKNYSLIAKIISVLEGKTALSKSQPDKITFMATFTPLPQERKEIANFEDRYQGFSAKVRQGFKKVMNEKAYKSDKDMAKTEDELKQALAKIEKFSYRIESNKQKDGYDYEVNMLFKCTNGKEAANLKELMMAWLAYTSSKTLSDADMVSFQANKVLSTADTCAFSIKLGSSKAEQYQFSSLIMSLMMQDKRFNSIFRR